VSPRDPRVDPEPGDVVQVRPWRTVYTRVVVAPAERLLLKGQTAYVTYTSHLEPGLTITTPLEVWRADAARPLTISEEEAEGFKRFEESLEVLGRAARLCRAAGHHCLSCCTDEEAEEFERRALAGEDVEEVEDDG